MPNPKNGPRFAAADQAQVLADRVEELARTVGRIPSSAPLPSRIREAAHILADASQALNDPDWPDE